MTSRNAPPEVLPSLLRGQVHTIGVGMHNFMDAAQVANAEHDPVVKARLDSCVFKGAVKRNGEWPAGFPRSSGDKLLADAPPFDQVASVAEARAGRP